MCLFIYLHTLCCWIQSQLFTKPWLVFLGQSQNKQYIYKFITESHILSFCLLYYSVCSPTFSHCIKIFTFCFYIPPSSVRLILGRIRPFIVKIHKFRCSIRHSALQYFFLYKICYFKLFCCITYVHISTSP